MKDFLNVFNKIVVISIKMRQEKTKTDYMGRRETNINGLLEIEGQCHQVWQEETFQIYNGVSLPSQVFAVFAGQHIYSCI